MNIETMSDQARRRLTAILAIASLAFGLFCHVSDHEYFVGPSFRTAIVFGVVWFAWYDLLRLPKFLFFLGPVVLAAVIIRPKLIFVFVGMAIPIWVTLKTLQFFSTPINKNRK